jgi:hypothetical protein
VNLLGDNIDTIKKNTGTLIDASKEVGLEVNTEKTKHMLLSRHQNAGQSYDIKIANRCFENEVTEEWRKLHNEELHNLYFSPNIIKMMKSRRMRWAGRVVRMGETKNAFRILMGKPEGRRPLGRQRRRWVDNIKINLDR